LADPHKVSIKFGGGRLASAIAFV